jgi:hypothetical protein
MDLESITLYLHRKHLGTVAISTEINSVLRPGTVGYLTITRYLRKQSFLDSSSVAADEREIEGPDAIDNATHHTLDEQPFASFFQFAKRILISMSIVRYHLVIKMAYKLKHCKWVPHRLSDAQKRARVAISGHLLDLLHSVQHRG